MINTVTSYLYHNPLNKNNKILQKIEQMFKIHRSINSHNKHFYLINSSIGVA